MAQINNKYVRSLSKLMEAGFSDEKAILAMTMDDILALPGISVAEIVMINGIQKAVKANKVRQVQTHWQKRDLTLSRSCMQKP